jgi:hypothetical protein
LGVARTLNPASASGRGIVRALDALSTPQTQAHCAAVAQRLAQPLDALALCHKIEKALA